MEEYLTNSEHGFKSNLKKGSYWIMRRIFSNFLKGILLIFPTAATLYIIYKSFTLTDDFLGRLVFRVSGYEFPGIGILITFFIITLIGYFISKIATGPIVDFVEKFLNKIPIVRTIYSSMKDFSEAIIGEKKKFNEPVLVKMKDSGIIKLGFVTQKDLSKLKLQNHSAVYFPYSYSFMGSLSIVPNDRLIPAEVNSTELMKFILSAGVTTLEEKEDHKYSKQSLSNNNDH
jgi:uncharacterized membrane protein